MLACCASLKQWRIYPCCCTQISFGSVNTQGAVIDKTICQENSCALPLWRQMGKLRMGQFLNPQSMEHATCGHDPRRLPSHLASSFEPPHACMHCLSWDLTAGRTDLPNARLDKGGWDRSPSIGMPATEEAWGHAHATPATTWGSSPRPGVFTAASAHLRHSMPSSTALSAGSRLGHPLLLTVT